MKISFLASHGGSSAKFLIAAMRAGQLVAEPGIVITNNRDSAIFHWCLDHNIDVRHISAKTHRGEENADEAIATVLQNAGSDLVVCSGYMKQIGAHTLRAFPGKILNIHPALLPKHGGKGMYGDHVHAAVLKAGEKESGASVHVVSAELDEGPVVLQMKVPVLSGDTVETLRARVQAVEPELYLAALQLRLKQNPNASVFQQRTPSVVLMTYIYHHNDCLAHDPGAHHAENSGRLSVIMTALRTATFAKPLEYFAAPLGTDAQILLAHTEAHLHHVKASAPTAGHRSLDPDTVMSPGSLNAALRGVGGACLAVDNLMQGKTQHAFCAMRPPGHHATPNRAMGFCIFNHVAIAALYAMQQHKLQRVAIVDFDVHHGNGSQDILNGKTGMLYLSTHQSPLYPGTGTLAENRTGNIHNVPLPSGTGDSTYQEIFLAEVLPELHAFKPQLLLVSAGFDAHKADPLAGMALTEKTYEWLGCQLREVADEYSGGKLLSVLEGGYNLNVLGSSVVAYLKGAN